jgi:magnesium-transporting ATPase (P-type)
LGFFQAKNLLVDESSFTGECMPNLKTTKEMQNGSDKEHEIQEYPCVTFMGTMVNAGRGRVMSFLLFTHVPKNSGDQRGS